MKKIKIIFACVLLSVLGFSFILSGCTKEKQTTLINVNLNEVVHSIFYAPQYVALEKGFFEEEGLKITMSVGQGADKSMAALISKEADIALMGTEAGLYVYTEGKENYAISFAQLTQRAGNFFISRTEDTAFTWDDVKGKTIIGGRAGGMPQMILEYILHQNGLDPKTDVEILTNLQFTTTAGAFVGGVGDYTMEFDPSALAVCQSGSGYAVASLGTESGYVPYTVYMATKEYIKANPDTMQKFTNAIYKGQKWVESHTSAEIAMAIVPYFKENTLADLEFMVERYKSQQTWKNNPVFEEESLTLIQDIMEGSGQLSSRVPYKDIVNTEFAKKAVDSIK